MVRYETLLCQQGCRGCKLTRLVVKAELVLPELAERAVVFRVLFQWSQERRYICTSVVAERATLVVGMVAVTALVPVLVAAVVERRIFVETNLW